MMCVIKETATDKKVFIVSHAFLAPVYKLYTLLKVVALQIEIYFKGIFNLYNVIFFYSFYFVHVCAVDAIYFLD